MTEPNAPYAFVELPDFCIPTPWDAGGPHRSQPHRDGISGEFTVSWTAETPILIGGSADNSQFHTAPDGTKVLPGSSIRGAIRSLIEALTMARMNHVHEDATVASRDYQTGSRWRQAMGAGGFDVLRQNEKPNLRAGFLSMKGKKYQLREVDWEKVRHSDIPAPAGFNLLTVAAKYGKLRLLDPLVARSFIVAGGGDKTGRLVMSGIDETLGQRRKQHEALFIEPAEPNEPITLTKREIESFLYIHSQAPRGAAGTPASALAFWQPYLDAGNEVPVFFINARENTKPELPSGILMSFAPSFKMPFSHSVGDLLNRRGAMKPEQAALDFVEALFGHVPKEGGDGAPTKDRPRTAAWRGRVQFGDARLVSGGAPMQPINGVLGSPRPSFGNYYLRSRGGVEPADWSTQGANLAGAKRYPLRGKAQPIPAAGTDATASAMAFVAAGAVFKGRVQFHNLLPQELGALLFTLFWDEERRGRRHGIGRGKAYGRGQLRADLGDITWCEHNSAPGKSGDYSFDLAAQRADLVSAFQDYVLGQYRTLKPDPAVTSFAAIPAVADVLAMQDPAVGASLINTLHYPAVPPPIPQVGAHIPAYKKLRDEKKVLPRYRDRKS